MGTKAHTTVVNRVIQLFAGEPNPDTSSIIDVIAGDKLIAVESSATLEQAIEQLLRIPGLRYIAVTNQDSLIEAKRLCSATPLGLINSQGEIVKDAAEN
ncbi:hypothetical protein NA78x_005560 [Anatilimnocola sp. NA78]|uniref:hypothetical protein n=1 Tax=Anatilimnocola sp. NA78 TaxID=3415683 RepID=UPI003CE55801